MNRRCTWLIAIAGMLLGCLPALGVTSAAGAPTKAEAAAALRKAAAFFREQVSVQGGYLYRYSEDLSLREGEGKATATMAWVQPPGTPSVGEAFLIAYERTGEEYYLDAAVETARALMKGQLESGGWDYRIEFDPLKRPQYAYRTNAGESGVKAGNVTTLDDDNTQAAVRLLMHVDRTLKFKDESIHEAVLFALESLLKAQYPNGAWPQRYSAPPRPEDFPVLSASFPNEWPRTWPNEKYASYYTLNDDTLADCMATMFEAAEIYGDARYHDAARRGGDFLILAQMPEPQPAWCQQYNAQMQPAWARKFEPPATLRNVERLGPVRPPRDRQPGRPRRLARRRPPPRLRPRR